MATIRRDIAPGKDKKGTSISQQTGTTATKLRGTPTSIAKPTLSSTTSQKQTPSYLRPTGNSNMDDSKQLSRKPASTVTVQKPTVSRIRSSDKKPASTLSVQKPTGSRIRSENKPASTVSVQKPTVSRIRSSDKTTLTTTEKLNVSTNVSHRSSLFSGKTGVSQKMVTGKNVKTPVKDVGKRSSVYGRPVSTVKKSSIKKKETEILNVPHQRVENSNTSVVLSTTIAAKEQQILNVPHQKVENSNTSVVTKPESQQQQQDQESCIPEAEEQIVQAVNNKEKGTDDIVMKNQELLNIGQIESESNEDASKIAIAEDNTVSENQDAPTCIKTDEVEDKVHTEQTSSNEEELEEHNVNEVIRIDNDENIEDNSNKEEKEDVEEKEVVEVQEITLDDKEEKEVKDVQEIATDKKEEVANGSEVNESKETEAQEVVEEKKQEAQNVPRRGKKESAVSNNVIEETASKLREQRKNKVRALAGAFETVISLQETK